MPPSPCFLQLVSSTLGLGEPLLELAIRELGASPSQLLRTLAELFAAASLIRAFGHEPPCLRRRLTGSTTRIPIPGLRSYRPFSPLSRFMLLSLRRGSDPLHFIKYPHEPLKTPRLPRLCRGRMRDGRSIREHPSRGDRMPGARARSMMRGSSDASSREGAGPLPALLDSGQHPNLSENERVEECTCGIGIAAGQRRSVRNGWGGVRDRRARARGVWTSTCER